MNKLQVTIDNKDVFQSSFELHEDKTRCIAHGFDPLTGKKDITEGMFTLMKQKVSHVIASILCSELSMQMFSHTQEQVRTWLFIKLY